MFLYMAPKLADVKMCVPLQSYLLSPYLNFYGQ